MILHRSLSEDLVEILVRSSLRGPCLKILQMPCISFWYALGTFSYQDFVRSSPAAAGPYLTILWDSLRGPGMKIWVTVFYSSLWGALVEILVNSSKRPLHYLVQVLVRRSRGDPLEIILKRSLHWDLADALRWCLCESSVWDVHTKFLYEACEILYIDDPWTIFRILLDVLVWGSGIRSWWVDITLLLAPKQIQAAVPIMSNLICYCSIATVVCTWYFDFLLPYCLGLLPV